MNNQSYFYQFLEPISKELAGLTRELESSIFTSPRIVLTHARVFVENILQQVIKIEKLPDQQWTGLKERLDLLNDNGFLTPEIRDALHCTMYVEWATKHHMIQDSFATQKHYYHGKKHIKL